MTFLSFPPRGKPTRQATKSPAMKLLRNGNQDLHSSGEYNYLPAVLSPEFSFWRLDDSWQVKASLCSFRGEAPGPYKDNQEAYANGNAVGLVSLLSDKGQKIYCGTPTGCEDSGGNDTLICYFKPTGITAETKPVT